MPTKITLDIELLKEMANSGKTVKEIENHFNVSNDLIRKYIKLYDLPMNKPIPRKWSDGEKIILSEIRKKWMIDNPDKHPWRNKNKFVSEPCEKVKEFLKELKVNFIEEYNPSIDDRSFSIDIAMPDKMIALEINGNQHYERDGKLKPYYQERHDLLESHGWIVYEIHYSSCFNLTKWINFTEEFLKSPTKIDFDYINYKPREKCPTRYYCIECGDKVTKKNRRCRKCANKINPRNSKKKLV